MCEIKCAHPLARTLPFQTRLSIIDQLSAIQFLIDTGADVSVLPKPHAPNNTKSEHILSAANKTIIATYGYINLTLTLGLSSTYRWNFIIADVDAPIIGSDFLYYHHLLPDLRKQKLIDGKALNALSCHTVKSNTPTVKVINIDNQYELRPLPSNPERPSVNQNTRIIHEYQLIINKFAHITTFNNDNKLVTTPTQHHIITKGPPVHSKSRRLAPEKLQAAKT